MSFLCFNPTLLYQTLGSFFADLVILQSALVTAVAILIIKYLCLRRRPSIMLLFAFTGLLATWLLTVPIAAVDQDANAQLVASLKLANTFHDRMDMLSDGDFVYDFADNPVYTFNPGSVCNADVATFPILTGSGMTVTQLNMGPCSVLPPHLHRALNLVVAVTGTTHTYMYPEDGSRVVQTMLSPGKMTVFPLASLHSMVNEGCGNNQLYSFLNGDDAGRLTVHNALWQFGPDIGGDIMPFLNVSCEDWNSTWSQSPAVGTGAIYGYEKCLQKCGLKPGYGSRVIRS